MKTLLRLFPLTLFVLSVLSISSCENKNENSGTGKLQISLNLDDESSGQLKSVLIDSVIAEPPTVQSYQLLISVEDRAGNPVLTDKLIPLYQFGSGFMTEDVEIKTGEFKLIKFLVINPSGQVIFAAPVAGSPLAYLVNRPLPLIFSINTGAVTKVVPEVIPVNDQSPDQFGYASFGVQIIRPLVFYTVCLLDNPLLMAPTQMTEATLTVYGNNNWHYTFKLQAAINRLAIRGGSDIYTFVLEKTGYPSQKMQFTSQQLLATTKENPLVLKIPWGGENKTLILQPGPELGKDAMVSNLEPEKNFGGHKYFEATFLSEPLLTVMRTNRSMIWFDMNALPKSAVIHKVVLTLYYDVPIPWDTTIRTAVPPYVFYGGTLQKIVEPWEEMHVTWNTQPKTVETNQVLISPFVKNVNFIDVDVTKLYLPDPAATVQTPNYGMLFKLYPSEQFPGFRFASSDYPEAAMRPKLTISYTVPVVVN